jgi:GH15 family glucan-1,4-alpha-glucosidase
MNHIGDYALLGDGHSAALVGRDGSIDWACFPRFDSPSVFCKILDEDRGGSFAILPERLRRTHRRYVEDANVLVTTFECEGGVLEVTDCMPVERFDPTRPTRVEASRSILRRVRVADGRVSVNIVLEPRFEYATLIPRFTAHDERRGLIAGGADALLVSATRALAWRRDRVEAHWALGEGESAFIEAAWVPSMEASRQPTPATDADCSRRLEDTIAFWQAWIRRGQFEGAHSAHVRRSALVLKALIHAPTGAVVAAPTTSLPERIGGGRNWDYRYTWIRDATLTLTSLMLLGFRDEADAFKEWISRTGAGRPEDLQIMYRIRGQRLIPEFELGHLKGHRGSAPVRIGNGAAGQSQLDCYGQLLEAADLFASAGGEITASNWRYLTRVTDIVCEAWTRPDQGIWEIRDAARHFTHSKLHCWVALDRALAISARHGLPAPKSWASLREKIATYLTTQCAPDGWFQQAEGFAQADASVLLVPAMGFLPTRAPMIQRTIERVRSELEHDGLVHRYKSADGLDGDEGAFLLCSFWLLDCLTHSGQLDEADGLLERLLRLSNDVGLFAEEASPTTGEALGNFPQAFTHMALVASCSYLAAAKRGEIPQDGAFAYAALALQRRAAQGAR